MQLPSTNKTAVLIFANSSGTDAARKGIPQSRVLFQALNEEIVRKVKKTGLPFFLYTEELQIGTDFATRFTTAIQSIFSKGYDHIISVGNDTPNLSVGTLIASYENLIQGKTVIGPSTDGGIYLLGIHKNRFDAVSFRQLPWQQQNLFQETARLFLRRGMLHQLPRLTDIDSVSDIQAVINDRVSLSIDLLRLLIAITRKQKLSKMIAPDVYSSYHSTQPHNKGSPSFL